MSTVEINSSQRKFPIMDSLKSESKRVNIVYLAVTKLETVEERAMFLKEYTDFLRLYDERTSGSFDRAQRLAKTDIGGVIFALDEVTSGKTVSWYNLMYDEHLTEKLRV